MTSLPGPAACITALTMSGQMTRRFAFEAFLPRDKKERAEVLKEMERDTRTLILYEAPHHLLKTLRELYEALGDRSVTICREMTKEFEEKGISFYEVHEPKGEFVLVIEGKSRGKIREEEKKAWEDIAPEEHMAMYEEKGLDRKSAMKAVAADRGISKREVYRMLLND